MRSEKFAGKIKFAGSKTALFFLMPINITLFSGVNDTGTGFKIPCILPSKFALWACFLPISLGKCILKSKLAYAIMPVGKKKQ
jgi:hypothetical protein